jgi:hypothetical protein
MRKIALAALGAAISGGTLLSATASRASDYSYDDYDAPRTVVTRRTVVERRVVVPPPARRVVREIVEERPVVYRPRPIVRDVVVERDGYYSPRRFGPRPVGYGYGPAFDPYD